MKHLPLEPTRKARYQSTDTITLLLELGFHSVGPGHWAHEPDQEIYERRPGDEPREDAAAFVLRQGDLMTYHHSLIEVYQELKKAKGAS